MMKFETSEASNGIEVFQIFFDMFTMIWKAYNCSSETVMQSIDYELKLVV